MNNTYYLSANTSGGYVSFLNELINGIRKVIVLKNAGVQARLKLFSQVIGILDLSNVNYDKIIRCGTADETDAVVLKDLSTIIADENLFASEIPLYADIIDFADHSRFDFDVQREVNALKNKIYVLKKRMYKHLSEAKLIHDEWEKIYISNMDYEIMNNESESLINSIFSGLNSRDDNYSNFNRFLGSLLPRGNINYIESLTADLQRRVFIKGRPGSGKSTFLKKIISKSELINYSTETYYCSFDSQSIDMVVIRDLGIAVFDSTSPHEIFPSKSTDEVFDIYDIAIKKDTDIKYENELMKISSEYNWEIKKAKECLYTISAYQKRADSLLYNKTTTETCIDRIIALSSLK